MKRMMLSLVAACLPLATVSLAQEPVVRNELEVRSQDTLPAPAPIIKSVPLAPAAGPEVQAVNDTWRQHHALSNDPQALVRANALARGQQRRDRMDSRKWYGYSNLRPIGNAVPHMSNTYSPTWVGNPYQPYDWAGQGWNSITPRSDVAIRRVTSVK